MKKHRGKGVSFKAAALVRDSIDPFEDLWCPTDRGTPTSPMSMRIPNNLTTMVDFYVHDPRFPWRSRSDFLVSAMVRLLEDVQRIEKDPKFDDSLKLLSLIHQELQAEEDGRRSMEACQKIAQVVNSIITDGDIGEARRLLANVRGIAEQVKKRRWREKILGLIAQYGELGQGVPEGD